MSSPPQEEEVKEVEMEFYKFMDQTDEGLLGPRFLPSF